MAAVINKIKSLAEEPTIIAEPKYIRLMPVFMPDTKAYTVSVTNPRKVGEKNAYVAYTVKTTNNNDKRENEVTRRYSDFDWLCERLKSVYPSFVVPQIPEKTLSGNFEESLMAFRARELMRFLQRVLAHPVMAEDEAVQTFISAGDAEFAARRNRKEGKGGFFDSLKQRAAGLTSTSKIDNDPEPWFTEKADDVLNREVLLTQMVGVTQKMINQYQTMIKKYTAHITGLREFMELISNPTLTTALENQCKALEQTRELLEDVVCQLTVTVNGNLIDYIHELQSVNAVLERRVPLVKTYLSAKNNGDSSALSEAQSSLDSFSNAARAEIEQVSDLRRNDMERFFVAIAHVYKSFFTLTGRRWDDALGNAAPSGPVVTQDAIDDADGAF